MSVEAAFLVYNPAGTAAEVEAVLREGNVASPHDHHVSIDPGKFNVFFSPFVCEISFRNRCVAFRWRLRALVSKQLDVLF